MRTRMGPRVGLMMGAGLCLACQLVSPGEGGLKLPDGLNPPGLPLEPRIGEGDEGGPRISLPDAPLPLPPPPQLPPFEPGTGSGTGTGTGTGPGTGTGTGTSEAPAPRPWLRASFYAGVSPQGLAVGDFNEDGAKDVAINAGGRGLQSKQAPRLGEFLLLLNDGAGGLEPASAPMPLTSSGRIAVGDPNGDGHDDVILGTSRGLRLLLGRGTGVLVEQPLGAEADKGSVSNLGLWTHHSGRSSALWSLAHARAPRPGTAGVFLTSAVNSREWTSQALSRGGAKVSPVLNAADEQTPGTFADFNADGLPDIALNEGTGQDRVLTVLLNNGSGVFVPQSPVFGTPPVSRLYAAHLNQDEHVDLLGLTSTSLVVFPGSGQGRFSFHAPVNLFIPSEDVAVVDYDQDGHMDAVVLHPSGEVSLLRGGAEGRLVPHARMKVGRGPTAAAVADLDHDGTLELLITEADDNVVSVYTVPPVPSWPAVFNVPAAEAPTCPLEVAVAPTRAKQQLTLLARSKVGLGATAALVAEDFDGDGTRDFALTREQGVLLMIRRADGSFLNRVLPNILQPSGLSAGDFDGDGRTDLAVSGIYSFAVLWNDPKLLFQENASWLSTYASVAGDFNGDGRVDLAVSARSEGCLSGAGRLSSLRQRTFDWENLFDHNTTPGATCLPPHKPVAGDYDGDGVLDLIHLSAGINLNPSAAQGRGARPGHGFELPSGFGSESWSVDATGDGKTDLLIRSTTSRPDMLLYPGDGRGSLLAPFTCPLPLTGTLVVWADLNGDGLLDVLARGEDGTSIQVLHGRGHGRWHEPRTYEVGGFVQGMFAMDVQGDARPELTVVTSAGELSIFALP